LAIVAEWQATQQFELGNVTVGRLRVPNNLCPSNRRSKWRWLESDHNFVQHTGNVGLPAFDFASHFADKPLGNGVSNLFKQNAEYSSEISFLASQHSVAQRPDSNVASAQS
jgi:hypothetical protein